MKQTSKTKRRIRLLRLKEFQKTDRARKARQAAKNKKGGKIKKSLPNVESNERELHNYVTVNIKPFHHTDDKNKFAKKVVKKEKVEKYHQEKSCVLLFQMDFLLLQRKQERRRYTNVA